MWNLFTNNIWLWITNNAPQLGIIVNAAYTALTGIVVLLMWRSNIRMKESIQLTQHSEEARSRPYIIVSIDNLRSGFTELRIANIGATPALDISVSSDPLLHPVAATGSVKQVGRIPETIGLLHHKITYLPPHQDTKALIGHHSGLKATYPDLTFNFAIDYNGIGGPYSESFTISLKPDEDSLHLAEYEVGDELHKIREILGRK